MNDNSALFAFDPDLTKNAANYVPLSPVSFLKRTAAVFPDRAAVHYGDLTRTWAETATRCRRLASAFARRGISTGDVVAVLVPNIPEGLEVHFAVPMTGGVLNMINTRLDADTIAYILEHGGAKVFIVDSTLSVVARDALSLMTGPRPLVVDIDDLPGQQLIGDLSYEALLNEGGDSFPIEPPRDEWQALALNYTSGTTGRPKGVVYHHRGAYITATGNALTWGMGHAPVYLWTLPMFHCNGWCFPWTITAMGGTHVCIRDVNGPDMQAAISRYGVTHLCGAPVVMSMLVEASPGPRESRVKMMTAASAPPAAVLAKIEQQGFDITHAYGLTEVYGPAVVCAWHSEWDALPLDERAAKMARQGVPYPVQEGLMVANPDGTSVPADGETIGEIWLRGNQTMKGYLNNPEANAESFARGWFHTGDLAVLHPDGYCEIKDRAKDIIISGGENISTIEVESALHHHEDVAAVAVVAQPDEKWGESPCAFVELRAGATVSEEELIAFSRQRLAGFQRPKRVVFGELPKTSTGKIQKFVLREKAKALPPAAG